MIEIEVDEDTKIIAQNHANERIKYEYDRFGLDKERRVSMIIIGTIGQLVFKKYLESENINFSFEFQAGQYDEKDFEINSNIIEVKTSGYDDDWRRLNLLYEEGQHTRGRSKKYAYCIQIFINGYNRKTKLLNVSICDKAIIVGGIKFDEIVNYRSDRQFYGDDYKVPLNELKSLEEILREIGAR